MKPDNSDSDFGFNLGPIIRPYSPRKLRPEFNGILFSEVPFSVKAYARELIQNQHWRIYVAEQDTGWCLNSARVIIYPSWLFTSSNPKERSLSFRIWYLSHELAHAMDECKHNHGPEFMHWLKVICPPEAIHHELGYKPRNAKAAGIGQKRVSFSSEDLGF